METLTLKAESSRLLDLVIHSLYTQREIFLRELISNASDALDRFRFESMLSPELNDDASPLEVRLEVDVAARYEPDGGTHSDNYSSSIWNQSIQIPPVNSGSRNPRSTLRI